MTKFSRVEVSPGEYLTRTSQPPEPKLLSSSLPSGLAFLRFPRTGMPIRIGTYGTHGSLNNGPFFPSLGKDYGSDTRFAGCLPGLCLGICGGPLGACLVNWALAICGSVTFLFLNG